MRIHSSFIVTCSLMLVAVACGTPPVTDGGADSARDGIGTDAAFDGSVDVALDARDVSTAPGPFGAACTRDSECESGICLSTGHCSRTCASGADCPASPNWMCVSLPGRGTVCDCTPRGTTDLPCNNVDDNCNGQIDETSLNCSGTCVDIASNPQNCGGCGVRCGGGTTCQNGMCVCPADHPTICGTTCAATQTDPANCGTCGNACPAGANGTPACVAGACTFQCNPGYGNCDGNVANGCELDVRGDPGNCGSCGHACAFANAASICSTGTCVMGACTAGFSNCDGDPTNGCESNTATDVANCGGCGSMCAPPHGVGSCTASTCGLAACQSGWANCDTVDTNGCEADTQTNPNNCGFCGHVCPGGGAPNMVGICTAGTCTTGCAGGWGDCDGNVANGCETSLLFDTNHCGTCSTVCASPMICNAGTCAPPCSTMPGTTYCGSACVNTSTDPLNCGSCGAICAAPRVCSGGSCNCTAGLTYCGGTCVNTATDPFNCGACGTTCPSGICSGGFCAACGGSFQPCCSGTTCNAGNVCVSATCRACGANTQPCCTGGSCNVGNVCSTGTCRTCGGSGQPCCTGGTCGTGYTCSAGTCVASCRTATMACTSVSQCCSGLSCRLAGTATICCREAGVTCTDTVGGADCCGAMACDPVTRRCTCNHGGTTCQAAADCCSFVCTSGLCVGG